MPIFCNNCIFWFYTGNKIVEKNFHNQDFDYPENDMPETFGDMFRARNICNNMALGNLHGKFLAHE